MVAPTPSPPTPASPPPRPHPPRQPPTPSPPRHTALSLQVSLLFLESVCEHQLRAPRLPSPAGSDRVRGLSKEKGGSAGFLIAFNEFDVTYCRILNFPFGGIKANSCPILRLNPALDGGWGPGGGPSALPPRNIRYVYFCVFACVYPTSCIGCIHVPRVPSPWWPPMAP